MTGFDSVVGFVSWVGLYIKNFPFIRNKSPSSHAFKSVFYFTAYTIRKGLLAK